MKLVLIVLSLGSANVLAGSAVLETGDKGAFSFVYGSVAGKNYTAFKDYVARDENLWEPFVNSPAPLQRSP